ncbi:hypothetical protein BDV40DRAFT_306843 [Aspergillus tamarii]|uniref:Uncharacterized protein n=1 Tax=Aspergillus tamarii TaxID=41984 RepID=A0A5N6UAJ0_ASPTM|nr:hypothetical protein BDV40DRAFT_306843 [Aspergillus tamarii]
MAANNIENLDHALLGTGRVDRFTCQQQFLLFYWGPANEISVGQRAPDGLICPSPTLTSADWGLGYITELSSTFAENIPPNRCTATEIESYLQQYPKSRELAANDVTERPNKHLLLDWSTLGCENGVRVFYTLVLISWIF